MQNKLMQLFQDAARLQGEGALAPAAACYREVIALAPNIAEAHLNLAGVLSEMKRVDEAVDACRKGVALRPDLAEGHMNLANLLKRQGHDAQAEAEYKKTIALKPDFIDAYDALGLLYDGQGRLDDALACFDRALARSPRNQPALRHRGVALFRMGRTADAFATYTRYAQIAHGAAKPDANAPVQRQRHDAEQRDWAAANGVGALSSALHLEGGARLSVPTINPDNDIAGIDAQWRGADPQIVVIDNLLTPEALEAMRRFCWGSTVWRKNYEDGYLGALPESGFASPLLAQITEELRGIYPGIFGAHPLIQAWGFKYDSTMRGIRLHADSAAVNVNFWITPDEANLDPESGGLVVFDKAAPLDWDFAKFNGNEGAARDFLKASGAKPITIPYRANRAVIFDSDLFHQTDTIRFRGGYTNRRINVTLLYGYRDPSRQA